VSALSTQLSWSHFVEILPLKDPLNRDFYIELCRAERWNLRTLRHRPLSVGLSMLRIVRHHPTT